MSQAQFQKRQREKDRREKAAAKRERKVARAEEAAAGPDAGDEPATGRSQEGVLAELAALHEQFDAEQIDFDTFADRKAELLAELSV